MVKMVDFMLYIFTSINIEKNAIVLVEKGTEIWSQIILTVDPRSIFVLEILECIFPLKPLNFCIFIRLYVINVYFMRYFKKL